MKDNRKVVFCAYRENKGATGGAGGVLYMLQEIIGSNKENIEFEYVFKRENESKKEYSERLLESNADFYICHDVVTGCLLSMKKKKYCLIYHQQGPLIEERTNLGVKLSSIKKVKTKLYEKRAFTKALSVHFPSNGAKDMYFKSKYSSCKMSEVTIGQTMYNTIHIEDQITDDDLIEVNGIKKDDSYLTFYSVGTLTEAKGQDRTVSFLEALCKKNLQKIRYIMIGQGVLKDLLIEKLDSMQNKYTNFTYHYIPRLSHEDIINIGRISDVYIMLHRISIFDLATLEAMYTINATVLSNIGGNIDFNKNDNVFYCDCSDYDKSAADFVNVNVQKQKQLNIQCFNEYFSEVAFRERYLQLVKSLYNE